MSRLTCVRLLVAVIVAGLCVAYLIEDPDAGVEVRAVAHGEPTAAHARITEPSRRKERRSGSPNAVGLGGSLMRPGTGARSPRGRGGRPPAEA
jgi:hypothetical protein